MTRILDSSAQILTIWDSESDCDLKTDLLILWQQFKDQSSNSTTISICETLEQDAEALREKILKFILNVGKSITNQKKTKHNLRPGLDYFWLTQFHSRPYTKSAQLNNLAKIFALHEIIQNTRPKKIEIHSNDRSLTRTIAGIAKQFKIEFTVSRPRPKTRFKFQRTKIKRLIPRPMLAVLALVQQIKTSVALRSKKIKNSLGGSISFFDYWYRFSDSVNTDRKFASQYWSALVNQLESREINWWHNLVDQHRVADLKNARSLLIDFNQNSLHRHEIFDSKISLKIIAKTLIDHAKLVVHSLPSQKFSGSFKDPESGIDFWPLFRSEWLNSHRGYESLINCLRFNRLESLLSKLPHQKLGIYLMENQPWEMALIHSWRKFKHGKLIGVAHSTVRFWDLRLMSHPKQFDANSSMPRPDRIAVNGRLAKDSLLESGYPHNEVVEVEALMYLHLRAERQVRQIKKPLVILVATDYLESATKSQMRLLEELAAANPRRFKFLLKPHWSQTLNNLKIDAEVVSGKKDLSHYFDQADVLYCSAITSAVIDGVCSGLPVIQCLDPLSFNLSPLRASSYLQTVRTSRELEVALEKINECSPQVDATEFFNLDTNLPKWKNLLQT